MNKPGPEMSRAIILWDKFLDLTVKVEFSSMVALFDLLEIIADNEKGEPLCDEEPHVAEFMEAFKKYIKAEYKACK